MADKLEKLSAMTYSPFGVFYQVLLIQLPQQFSRRNPSFLNSSHYLFY